MDTKKIYDLNFLNINADTISPAHFIWLLTLMNFIPITIS